jgi:c-di-GMP-binding flagellar brake protein YcgR
MFADTRPADLGPGAGPDGLPRLDEFRVGHPGERLALLRQLRDGASAVVVSAPDGTAFTTTLWAIDDLRGCLSLQADERSPALARVLALDEATAVAYLDSIKLQFDLGGFTLVHGRHGAAVQAPLPREVWRFQRRGSFRVRVAEAGVPMARFRHPAMPEMALALRLLDVSLGGCALALPGDVPPLQPGTEIGLAQIELDRDTHFTARLTLQHAECVSAASDRADRATPGLRLGCAWDLGRGHAEHQLQRWLDQAQRAQRRGLL